MKQSQNGPNSSMKSSDDEVCNQRLSMSLMRLNSEDRNEIGEEIHGVRSMAREETPELINESLHRMNAELERIISLPQYHGCAFKTARSLPGTFVNDRDFRLKFLRCDLFNPIDAADRMLVCMDYLLLLFGRRALVEPLNISFFNDEELAALREGYIQLLPFRDRSGRRVLVVLSKALSYTPILRVRRRNRTIRAGLFIGWPIISSNRFDANCFLFHLHSRFFVSVK